MNSFSSSTVKINENGIYLLRNRFAYQHLNFPEVQNFSIEDGYLLKNRILILITGVAMIVVAAKLFVPVLTVYSEIPDNPNSIGRGLAFMQMIPLVLIGFGGFFFIQSFRKSKILHFNTRTEQFNIRIREIENDGFLSDLETFLAEKIAH